MNITDLPKYLTKLKETILKKRIYSGKRLKKNIDFVWIVRTLSRVLEVLRIV